MPHLIPLSKEFLYSSSSCSSVHMHYWITYITMQIHKGTRDRGGDRVRKDPSVHASTNSDYKLWLQRSNGGDYVPLLLSTGSEGGLSFSKVPFLSLSARNLGHLTTAASEISKHDDQECPSHIVRRDMICWMKFPALPSLLMIKAAVPSPRLYPLAVASKRKINTINLVPGSAQGVSNRLTNRFSGYHRILGKWVLTVHFPCHWKLDIEGEATTTRWQHVPQFGCHTHDVTIETYWNISNHGNTMKHLII